ERQLDQADHLVMDGRKQITVQHFRTVARWSGESGAGGGSTRRWRGGSYRRELRACDLLHLAPPIDEAVELVRVHRVHSQDSLCVGYVRKAEVDQALLAVEHRLQLAVDRGRLAGRARTNDAHPLHQL